MEELVKLVSQKAGIPAEQAKAAVETVLGFLKEKLPAPIAGQVEAAVGGFNASTAENLVQGLGGLLGKH